MSAVTRSANVQWTGTLLTGCGTLTSQSRALVDTELTFPRRTGEPEGHTSPEELLASAHAGCFAMSLASALAGVGINDAELDVEARVDLERVGGVFAITRSSLAVDVTSGGVAEDQLSALLDEADKRCPFSNLIRATATVSITSTVRRPG